ncbi:MAG: hypothetical protein WD341_19515 [Tistlia sp.]|uniref:hypothetical protein n=1 Tax=Tistlia sp. TaxID=3057121 RepID=UPI0034A4B4CE
MADDGGNETAAEEALRLDLKSARLFAEAAKQPAKRSLLNSLVARNVLREELDWFGPYEGTGYSLTEAQRNRLLAHCRQDAALGAVNSGEALDRLDEIQRSLRGLHRLLLLLIIAMGSLGAFCVSRL